MLSQMRIRLSPQVDMMLLPDSGLKVAAEMTRGCSRATRQSQMGVLQRIKPVSKRQSQIGVLEGHEAVTDGRAAVHGISSGSHTRQFCN